MSYLKKLVEEDNHHSQSMVDNKEYKTIAQIYLEQIKKALKLSKKSTFEHYAFFKLT